MSMLIPKLGRPRYVAQVELVTDLSMKWRDKFHKACSTFHYRDIMALSRALGVHPRTIEAWKYLEQVPRMDILLEVIEWYENGKPMELQREGDRFSLL